MALALFGVGLALSALPLDHGSAAVRLAVVLLPVGWVGSWIGPKGSPTATVLLATVAVSSVLALAVEFPAGLELADAASVALSQACTFAWEPPLAATDAYLPVLPFLNAIVLVASDETLRRGESSARRAGRGALRVAACLLVLSSTAVALRWLPPPQVVYPEGGMFAADLDSSRIGRIVAGVMPSAAVAIAMAAVVGCTSPRPPAGVVTPVALSSRRALVIGAALCALALGSLWDGSLTAPSRSRQRVLFYKGGMVNWLKPTASLPGKYGIGMLGLLPDFVQRLGFSPEFTDNLEHATLDGNTILVVVNLDHDLGEGAFAKARSFVRAGGALLLVGDHTFRRGAEEILMNRLLEDTAIRLNFDTANSYLGGWLRSYRVLRTPLGTGLDLDYNRIGNVAGCSLDVERPAWTAVAGRYGYADAGDASNAKEALLGDMQYVHGERLGDLPLVAGQVVENGKVLVCGDTTSFINELLPASHEFVNRCFTWLSRTDRVGPPTAACLTGFVTFMLGSAAVVAFRSRIGFALFVAAVPAAAVAPRGLVSSLPVEGPALHRVAAFDRDCFPSVPIESGSARGLGSVRRAVIRSGYVPLEGSARELLTPGQLQAWFVVAPTVYPGDEWNERIRQFAVTGGRVVVSAGPQQRDVLRPLLDLCGVEIGSVPLGPVAAVRPGAKMSVTFVEAWNLVRKRESVEVVLTALGYPVIVRTRLGAGEIVVVGDARFLGNENLEPGDQVRVGTLGLIDELLQYPSQVTHRAR